MHLDYGVDAMICGTNHDGQMYGATGATQAACLGMAVYEHLDRESMRASVLDELAPRQAMHVYVGQGVPSNLPRLCHR